jgi:hypothetical protein
MLQAQMKESSWKHKERRKNQSSTYDAIMIFRQTRPWVVPVRMLHPKILRCIQHQTLFIYLFKIT